MAKYQRFEELPVWQEAAKLYNRVLDLFESNPKLSPSFRNQLERAALSVSNNISEGYERVTTSELLAFLAIARGSAGEVRSMIAVVSARVGVKAFRTQLLEIRELSTSCARQITAWISSIEDSPIKGKRHLTGAAKAQRTATEKVLEYRLLFLRTLKPEHPLYRTPEARAARGEPVDQ
jgi:four helix bundle protein